MTLKERRRPEIVNGSRRRRIARGAGTSVEEVNRLLRQHAEMKRLMKRFGSGGDPRRILRSLGM
jgi:signal recognition particle subunit SRP54